MTLIQKGNSKLNNTYMFNIVASQSTCGRICKGCYALSEQNRYKSVLQVREARWRASARSNFPVKVNYELSRLKEQPKFFRIHASGEFYSQDYIDKWYEIAKANPFIIFYAYTKRMKHFNFNQLKSLPNFILINSLQWGKLNYGKLEDAPTDAFICPAQSGTTNICGNSCTYCMQKTAQQNGVYFIQH